MILGNWKYCTIYSGYVSRIDSEFFFPVTRSSFLEREVPHFSNTIVFLLLFVYFINQIGWVIFAEILLYLYSTHLLKLCFIFCLRFYFHFFSLLYTTMYEWISVVLFQSIKRIAWHQTVTRIAASIPINLWLWRVGVDTLLLRWNISFSNVLFLIALFRTVHNNCFFINFVVIKEII